MMTEYLRFLDAWPSFGPFLSLIALLGAVQVAHSIAAAFGRFGRGGK